MVTHASIIIHCTCGVHMTVQPELWQHQLCSQSPSTAAGDETDLTAASSTALIAACIGKKQPLLQEEGKNTEQELGGT